MNPRALPLKEGFRLFIFQYFMYPSLPPVKKMHSSGLKGLQPPSIVKRGPVCYLYVLEGSRCYEGWVKSAKDHNLTKQSSEMVISTSESGYLNKPLMLSR